MNKFFEGVKATALWIKDNVMLVGGLVIGVLVYWLAAKNKKIASLKTEIELADTHKKVDLIEADIEKAKAEQKMHSEEAFRYADLAKDIEKKRKDLSAKEGELKPNEAEDFWNKK